jgi:F-type H+-transporting ATPase subunit b
MKEARERASGVHGESEKRGAQIVEEAKAAAKAEADRIIAGAREQIASEVAKAKTELREQVAALAVAGAEKILQREVDAKAHAEMLGKLKAQL